MMILFVIVSSFLISPSLIESYNKNQINDSLFSSGLISHPPIIISSDADFSIYDFTGDGTIGSPYLIQGYEIIASGYSISISGTTKFFEIRDCNVQSFDESSIFINSVASGTVFIADNYLKSYSKSAVQIWNGCHYSSIINNTMIAVWDCLEMFNCDNSMIIGNIMSNSGSGIWIEESDYCIIANNTCNNNEFSGIFVCFSESCHITDNIVKNNGYEGIPLDSVSNSLVENNFCENNGWYNIFSLCSDYLEIYNNTCIGSDNGIVLDGCYHKIIDNFCFKNRYNGMNLEYIDNSTIYRNLLLENLLYGVAINSSTSTSNTLYYNFFIYNNEGNIQAYDKGIANNWFNITKNQGNYWSDLEYDFYNIDGPTGSVDLYPLPLQDSDSDGLDDYLEEFIYFTDINNNDSDSDGLLDGEEVNEYGTNPLSEDTDEDGYSDGVEVESGTDPLDPTSFPTEETNTDTNGEEDNTPDEENKTFTIKYSYVYFIAILLISSFITYKKKNRKITYKK